MDRGLAPLDDLFARGHTKGEYILTFLRENGLSDVAPGLVVEVGCGPGGTLAYFRERGFRALGCDLHTEAVQFGRTRHGLDVHRGDLTLLCRLVAESRSRVALIVMEQILEHVPYPATLLSDIRTLMDSDTVLFIGVPGIRNVDRHYESDLLNYFEVDHFSHFELASLTSLLGQCGLKLLAGDETIRAGCALSEAMPFRPDPGMVGRTLDFLCAVERRRRLKAIVRRIWRWPVF
jgi:SAM-dependent methyltransferase